MQLEPFKFVRSHNRRSIRLKGYDYSQPGGYFVTVVAHRRVCLFGEVRGGEVQLSAEGRIVANSWKWLGRQYRYVELDAWVVMPNHLHGVIIILDEFHGHRKGSSRTAPTNFGSERSPLHVSNQKRKPLGRLVGAFKTVSTKQINQVRGTPGESVWQRNYYEHVIRNESDLENVRAYIDVNPTGWADDLENPANA